MTVITVYKKERQNHSTTLYKKFIRFKQSFQIAYLYACKRSTGCILCCVNMPQLPHMRYCRPLAHIQHNKQPVMREQAYQ